MKRREEMNFWELLYIPEIIRGLGVTIAHFLKNALGLFAKFLGLRKDSPIATIEYPDVFRPYPPRYRGRHRLTLHEDGRVKCTACFLCATACPARCIYIEPEEHSDPKIEKFPHRYEIDTLLCIYCGYCVEACPVDAIRMDTGLHPEVYDPDPRLFIEDKETLMKRSEELLSKGPEQFRKEHLASMKKIERRPFA